MKPTHRLEGPQAPSTAITLLNSITPLLHADLGSDMADLAGDLQRSTTEDPELEAFTADLKFTIQSFFALAEATTNSFASAAIGSNVAIPAADMAVLLEKDYDEQLGRYLDTTRRYSLIVRAQVSFRSFLLACSASPRPAWPPHIITHFKAVTHARNRFTHPTKLEYLSPVHAFEDFRQVAAWFPAEVMHILAAAARQLGVHSFRVPPEISIPSPARIFPDPSTILNAEFYNHILSTPGAAIAYMDLFSRSLHRDLQIVMAFSSSALRPPYDERLIGRAVRRAIRTIAQTAEGELGFSTFFMRAVRRRRSKISVPEQVKGESVPSRLVRVLASFSAALGGGFEPAASGKTWDAMNTVFLLRDRLIHPRRPSDIDLKVEHLSIAMIGLSWLNENSFPALLLDQDKVIDLIGTRPRAPNPSAVQDG